jgi:hypothetical protein
VAINKTAGAIGWCDNCGKLLYLDRSKARAVGRQHRPHKGTYRCPVNGQMWHVGRVPRAVIEGHLTRDEYFHREEA